MGILEDWYYGRITPHEAIVPSDPNYMILGQKISDERAYFMSSLTLDDQIRFEKLINLIDQSSSLMYYENFAYGFKLSTTLLSEVYNSNE